MWDSQRKGEEWRKNCYCCTAVEYTSIWKGTKRISSIKIKKWQAFSLVVRILGGCIPLLECQDLSHGSTSNCCYSCVPCEAAGDSPITWFLLPRWKTCTKFQFLIGLAQHEHWRSKLADGRSLSNFLPLINKNLKQNKQLLQQQKQKQGLLIRTVLEFIES